MFVGNLNNYIMKIIIYNNTDQYALSRKQIELIKTILPNEYFEPIKEFHITPEAPGQEKFEYNYDTKIAYFEYPLKQKTKQTYEDALFILLTGLCRIKAKVKFGHYMKKNEIEEYLPFIQNWLQVCLKEIKKT